ncbi:MAG: hypothetical protein MJ229_01650 [bacterium]|nr:hypothetical protein [bacterium]
MFISGINNYSYSINNSFASKQKNNNATQPSFGLHNPQAALERAKDLKALYSKEKIYYLMPDEVWSFGRINKAIKQVDKEVKELIEKGEISVGKVQKSINKVLPDKQKNRIKVKELQKYIKRTQHSLFHKEDMVDYDSCEGLSIPSSDKKRAVNSIYLPFNKLYKALNNDNGYEQAYEAVNFRITLAHELQHAMTSKFTNIYKSSSYHLEKLGKNENDFDTQFFNCFEDKFYKYFEKFEIEQTQSNKPLSQELLLKKMHVKDEKKLFKMFDKACKEIVNENYPKEYIDNFKSKQFYKYMSCSSADEKRSYLTNEMFRELFMNPEKPLNCELTSYMYGEMEKFFAKKAKDAQKLAEK